MTDERKSVVARAYDAMVEEFLEWGARGNDTTRDELLAAFMARLPAGGSVLDLGCGAGIPSTRLLAERFRVTGVDISAAQVAAARRNVPLATFLQADLAALEFAAGSFDGIAAFYSISHVPREEHAHVFARIARWLRPGGLFVASLSADDSPDWQGEWLGQPMFFSGHDADANRRLLRDAGFELLVEDDIDVPEPEGSVSFLWVLAARGERQFSRPTQRRSRGTPSSRD
jgi:SAM-dependent methyltransferase